MLVRLDQSGGVSQLVCVGQVLDHAEIAEANASFQERRRGRRYVEGLVHDDPDSLGVDIEEAVVVPLVLNAAEDVDADSVDVVVKSLDGLIIPECIECKSTLFIDDCGGAAYNACGSRGTCTCGGRQNCCADC